MSVAWAGSDRPGQGHDYAIQGPTLLIEDDNTQDGANHDWAGHVLVEHYRAAHRRADAG